MKKIGIDMSHYGKMSGYGVVATNIINELLKSNNYEFYLLSYEKKELPDNLKNKTNVHLITSNIRFYFLYRLWTQASLLKKYNIDIFYTPDQMVPLRKVCKYISTIHDLYGYKNFRGIKSLRLYDRRTALYHFLSLDKIFAKKSNYIITPSIASKKDILNELKINHENVIVGHWGMNHMNIIEVNYIKKDYILFPLCADFDNHFIFRLGEKIIENGYAKKIIYRKPQNDIGILPILNNKNTELLMKRLSDDEKIKLLSEAKLSIYISEMEGFGFVPLECQACGCPVIYHNIGSLDEIIGNTGIGINGLNVDDYIFNVKKIIMDTALYDRLLRYGLENVKSFNRKDVTEKIENFLLN